MLCVVGWLNSICPGNLSEAGVSVTGSVHGVSGGVVAAGLMLTKLRQTLPASPGRFAPGHDFVVTAYPFPPCATNPPVLEFDTRTTFGNPGGAPICPALSPLLPVICSVSAFPLICPVTEAAARQG